VAFRAILWYKGGWLSARMGMRAVISPTVRIGCSRVHQICKEKTWVCNVERVMCNVENRNFWRAVF